MCKPNHKVEKGGKKEEEGRGKEKGRGEDISGDKLDRTWLPSSREKNTVFQAYPRPTSASNRGDKKKPRLQLGISSVALRPRKSETRRKYTERYIYAKANPYFRLRSKSAIRNGQKIKRLGVTAHRSGTTRADLQHRLSREPLNQISSVRGPLTS